MAIRKHALTKEGAIVAITRKQLKDMGKETDIQKSLWNYICLKVMKE